MIRPILRGKKTTCTNERNESFGIGVVRETAERFVLAPELITARGILFNCDCMLLFSGMRSESVDLVFADPPFNLGKDYGTHRVSTMLIPKSTISSGVSSGYRNAFES